MPEPTTPLKFIYRSVQSHDFTVLPNALLRNKALSFKARGMAAMLLSNREDWNVYAGWIEEQGTEGREAVAAAMKELEAAGYMVFAEAPRVGGKFMGGTWLVYDTPVPVDQITNKTKWREATESPPHGKPGGGESGVGKPNHGKPGDGKPTAKNNYGSEENQQKQRASSTNEAAGGGEPGLFDSAPAPETKTTPDWPRAAFRDLWNTKAPSLAAIRDISGGREKAARARYKDLGDLPSAQAFFEKIEASDFLTGRTAGHGGRIFKATFDWCLKPHNFDKIREGMYTNKPRNPTPTPNGQPPHEYKPRF